MRFASVETGIWRWFVQQGLTLEEQHLMLYLLTNPHTNMIGYYYLSRAYMQDDTGFDSDTLDRVFAGLRERAKVYYDDRAKVILLADFLEHNRIESEKQVIGALRAAKEVPRSPLLPEFVKAAKHHCPRFADRWDSLLIGYRYPIDTVPLSLSITGTDTDTVSGSEEEGEEEEAMRLSTWVKWYEEKFVISPSAREFNDFAKLQAAGVTDDLIVAVLEDSLKEEGIDRPLLWAKRRISDMLPRGVRTREDYERRKAAKAAPVSDDQPRRVYSEFDDDLTH